MRGNNAVGCYFYNPFGSAIDAAPGSALYNDPSVKKYYDGLVKAYYYSNQFEEVVDLYSDYLLKFVEVNAEVLYLFSVSLVNTGDNRGCDNIRIMSTNTNYPIDQKLLIACGYTL